MTNQSNNTKSRMAHHNLLQLIEEDSKAGGKPAGGTGEKQAGESQVGESQIQKIPAADAQPEAKEQAEGTVQTVTAHDEKNSENLPQEGGLSGDTDSSKHVTISVGKLKRRGWENFFWSCRELTQDLCENINWSKFWARFVILMLFPITWGLNYLAGQFPEIIDAVFTNGINYFTRYGISWVTSIVPFSLGELLIYMAAGAIFASLVVTVIKFIKAKLVYKRIYCCIGFISGVCCFMAVAVFSFQLLWGFNHYREPLTDLMRLPVKEASLSEITDVCEDLAKRAAAARAEIAENEDGICEYSKPIIYYLENADTGIRNASKYFSALDYTPTTAKALWSSKFMSKLGITGVYCAWTAEANVNVDIPIYEIPATVCHELAHQMGIARENEANFLGFISCVNHTEAEYKYSGLMLALKYCMNELQNQGSNREYDDVKKLYSDGMLRDLEFSREYWEKEDGVTNTIATAANDAYLKFNGHSDGVKLYGMFVDLILSYYREGYMNDVL